MRRLMVVVAALAPLVGCEATQQQDVGVAEATISTVPVNVKCVRIGVANGVRTLEHKFAVTSGQSASLMMGGLPTGYLTFVGDAFSVSCSSVSTSTSPGWTSDPTYVYVAPASMVNIGLSLHPAANVTVGVDFVLDGSGGPFDLTLVPNDLAGPGDGAIGADLAGPTDGGVSGDLAGPTDGATDL